MHKAAVKVYAYLEANQIVDREKEEIYVYGLEVMLLKGINYLSLLILAVMWNALVPTLCFMAAFFSLRGRTGGYHAKSAAGCYTGTLGIFILVSCLAPVIAGMPYLLAGIMMCSVAVVMCLAPVNHPDLNLDDEEIKVCRKASRRVIMIQAAAVICMLAGKFNMLSTAYAALGTGAAAVLLIVAKFKGQEV